MCCFLDRLGVVLLELRVALLRTCRRSLESELDPIDSATASTSYCEPESKTVEPLPTSDAYSVVSSKSQHSPHQVYTSDLLVKLSQESKDSVEPGTVESSLSEDCDSDYEPLSNLVSQN